MENVVDLVVIDEHRLDRLHVQHHLLSIAFRHHPVQHHSGLLGIPFSRPAYAPGSRTKQ